MTKWREYVKRAIGIKRDKLLIEQAKNSIGLASSLTAAPYELRQILEQRELFSNQME